MEKNAAGRRDAPNRRSVVGALVYTGLVIAITIQAILWYQDRPQFGPILDTSGIDLDAKEHCPSNIPPLATPPAPVNVWASLTINETTAIREWLQTNKTLNLTRAAESKANDNTVFLVENYLPSKAAALKYLQSPTNEHLPAKYARVTIHHGGLADPYVKNYLVGPLPINHQTEINELNDIYHNPTIPYNARGVDNQIFDVLKFLKSTIDPISEATKDLFNMTINGLANDTHIGNPSAPFSYDGEFRKGWVSWRINTAGAFLRSIGFWMYVDFSGTDPSLWRLLKIVYNHQIFDSADHFMQAYRNGTLTRSKRTSVPDRNSTTWSDRARRGPKRDLDHLPGPRGVSFGGLRFRVDKKTQFISWMGWDFYLSFNRDMGLGLFNIRLKGERLIYELTPQEALATYAGTDPSQANIAFLDRYFGMGVAVRNMIPGYDCPYDAVFLPSVTEAGTSETGICIFELDTGRPISRHAGFNARESGSTRGYVLVVRSISTVGNYDYLFDYIFHLDGTIEVKVAASGYLYGTFWEETQAPYGTRIQDISMGSFHDHSINFKVDLDVGGPKNTLLKTSITEEEIEAPWDNNWTQLKQAKIVREYIENEDDSAIEFTQNSRTSYSIVNRDQPNSWGAPRGYSIHPGISPVHYSVTGAKKMLNNANWGRYHLSVTKRKETELSSSSMWNMNLPGAPTVDFHKFFDGESITQEDLVLWINVGTHHLPVAEDSPNTKTNLASSSFFLTPSNYFDYDISVESLNSVVLSPPSEPGHKFSFDDHGVIPRQCLPEKPPPLEWEIPIVIYGNVMAPNSTTPADAFLAMKGPPN